jgi:hypothetical protein
MMQINHTFTVYDCVARSEVSCLKGWLLLIFTAMPVPSVIKHMREPACCLGLQPTLSSGQAAYDLHTC